MTKEQNEMRKCVEKNAGGITLIALVVTIVVLIILAGVAINLSLGNNGLFNKAKQAREEYKVATNEEQSGIANVEKAMDELTGKKETRVNIGEYIDYPIDLNNNGKPDDWKIFYVANGNAEGEQTGGAYENNIGDIYIIAADYLKNTDSRFPTNTATMGTISKNGEYSIYWTDTSALPTTQVIGTESLTVTGRGKQTTINNLFMQNKFGELNSNNNCKAVSVLINTANWNGYVNASYADYAIGAPTLEMWVASWNAVYGDKLKLYTNKNENGYYVGKSSTSTNYSQSITSVPNWQKNTLYFPYGNSAYSDCYGSWLASPPADSTYHLMLIYCEGGLYFGNCDSIKLGARPLVHLNSNIQLEKNSTTGVWQKVN